MEHNRISELYGNKLRVRVSGILIVEQRILLIKHQLGEENDILWAPPGGALEYGEHMKQGVIREFKEETGLSVEVGEIVRISEYIRTPLHAIEIFFEIMHYLGDILIGTDPEMQFEKQIIKEVKFLTLEEIKALPSGKVHKIFDGVNSLNDLLHKEKDLLL